MKQHHAGLSTANRLFCAAGGVRCLLACGLVFSLSACASLEDFQKMTPAERARTVCESRSDYAGVQRKIRDFESRVAEADEAMRKGVRSHRQCNRVKVYGDKITTCTTIGNTTQCRESRPERFEKQCVDVLLPIDVRQEKENRDAWAAEIKALQARGRQVYGECFASVVKLSVEDAYKLY
ncbi:hypothetical protein [Crenobacter caeni]|uniref:Lipoprotein n=1 Tax=Crenobacter caeni TaxID=2705474 RepID=A0A6B2KRT2_9NEIS|nr:hypothetical protein [Crenobacter caeni]NDV12657.1 hypothetical protein [Crenobacter caeni]